ncbi:expansin [Marchantia polymorpha subsp. ruderalis]|uniref:Expansin n=2 Tax=Marchantia polymorpha TaxID=3197 RepID=A0AAF6BCJ4_MARPO|nr:hypothetical protein MARPO_0090s0012 [Marchantia polymorpha]BBN09728.1 hypothetical protein Mp_4g22170 [Marchantia polymorpha subsp. ruderalis]|eukprot:PTQ33261.1 hypothetical protein MARPO_0090s0012 [Marchantia polymorpha]
MAQLFVAGLCVLVSIFWFGESLGGVEGLKAHATFLGGSDAVGTNNGACGYSNVLAMGYGTRTAALSAPIFREGKSCGACYKLRCRGSESVGCRSNDGVVVTVTDVCPERSVGGWCDGQPHFRLSEPAFAQIAEPKSGGLVEVDYEKVSCDRRGGMHFLLVGHTHFLQILVHNVGGCGDVAAVSVKGGTGPWIRMSRSWGQLWHTGEVLDGQALSISVTMADGKVCVSNNFAGADWKYGQTFEGAQL